jgi:hypothetical protein
MERDRFDDVEFRFLEHPAEPPPRPPRRRRWVLGIVAGLLIAGGVTAGASALTGSGEKAVTKAAPTHQRHYMYRNADGVPVMRSGPECHTGKAHRRGAAHSTPRGDVQY